jgi:hypothetical protein
MLDRIHKPWRFVTFFIGLVPLFVFWDALKASLPGFLFLLVGVSYAILVRFFANWVSRRLREP